MSTYTLYKVAHFLKVMLHLIQGLSSLKWTTWFLDQQVWLFGIGFGLDLKGFCIRGSGNGLGHETSSLDSSTLCK